jgi:dihydropyrimidinase
MTHNTDGFKSDDTKTKHPIIIKGGHVVTPEEVIEADVWIEGEIIRAVGTHLPISEGTHVIDATGMFVLPGIIDAHAHIQLDTGIYQTPDDWYTETAAAACGGVTTVIDFATQFKGQTLTEAMTARLEETAPAVIDYALHMMVTDLPPGQEDELGALTELGVQSVKLYTTYRPNYYADDAVLLRLLEAAGRYGLITLVHCENDAIVTAQTQALVEAGKTGWRYHGMARPALAEQEATARVLFLAQAARAPVVIAHNSTARTSLLVAEARERGQPAFCETAPQYLLLDNRVYEGSYTQRPSEPWRYILQPPLRAPEEKEKLWALVREDLIDMIITDHCAYSKGQKTTSDDFTKTPGGLPGLEVLLPLMATYGVADGRITWSDLVRMMAANPAKIYNLWPRKGCLLPGSDADVVIYDPAPETVIREEAQTTEINLSPRPSLQILREGEESSPICPHTIAGYSPYEGMRINGRVVTTIRRGEVLVHEGIFRGKRGSGQFIKRAAYQT